MRAVVETYDDLGITRVSRWIWNTYVLHEAKIVVDAGLLTVADDLAPVIEDLGGEVRAVVATHGHSDHLGGAPGVAARFGAEVHLPGRLVPLLAGGRARNPGPLSQAKVLPVFGTQPADPVGLLGLLRGTQIAGFGLSSRVRWPNVPVAGSLDDGDELPGGGGWRVVAAPGHTDDSIALWHEPTATLLAGDALLTRGGRAWFTPEFVDADAARATETRLRGLPAAHLLPGHGRPVHHDDVWAATYPSTHPPRR